MSTYKILSKFGDALWFTGAFVTAASGVTYFVGPVPLEGAVVGASVMVVGWFCWFASGFFREAEGDGEK